LKKVRRPKVCEPSKRQSPSKTTGNQLGESRKKHTPKKERGNWFEKREKPARKQGSQK